MKSILILSLTANVIVFAFVGMLIESKNYDSAIIYGAINVAVFIRNLFYVKDL